MHQHQQLIETFYSSFQQHDHAGMIACYHPNVHFSDPAFTNLHGKQAMAMWHMLVERGTDLKLTYSGIEADDKQGKAHWEAAYSFGKSRRKVHNIIDAQFTFQDGKIIRHVDQFDLWRWSGMALGPIGKLLGWSRPLREKVSATAMDGLNKFIAKHPEYQ